MALRDYQEALDAKIDEAIDRGSRSILATCPTGGGKTHLISHRAMKANGPTVDIAHRQELVCQISMALARDDVWHRILAPDSVQRFVVNQQIKEFGRSRVHHSAQHTVASIDTLIARRDDLGTWINQVALAQIDEAHHCLPNNKWGRGLSLFPNAMRIGWTATPCRSDYEPLRGVFDTMVEGPSVAELLARGFLCQYRIYGPPPSIDVSAVPVSSSGDFSPKALRDAAHKSTITGDMIQHYRKLTPGAVGIGFLVDVEQAKETSERFNADAGAPLSVWMSSRETNDAVREENLRRLRAGDLKMIFNVDLLGEGVDVPRVEVVLDGAPTESLGRYLQRFGRLLRPFPGKSVGHYVDLAGNVLRHGLPDTARTWSLDAGKKRSRLPNDDTALKACLQCFHVFERYRASCPACGFKPEPQGRTLPEMVDGDLTEYAPELLAKLRGDADKIMRAAPPGLASYVVENWNARAVTQAGLRDAIERWAGVVQHKLGHDEPTMYRLFWHRFGVDVLTAQSFGRGQAAELSEKIWEDINNVCSRPKGSVPAMVPVDDMPKKAPDGNGSVRQHERTKSWGWQITINGQTNSKHGYETEQETRDALEHFKNTGEKLEPKNPRQSPSGSVTTTYHEKTKLWRWQIRINGKIHSKKGYETEQEARNALEHFKNTGEKLEPKNPRKSPSGSGSVRQYKRTKLWYWRITINGEPHTKVGYATEQEARNALEHFINTGEKLEPKNPRKSRKDFRAKVSGKYLGRFRTLYEKLAAEQKYREENGIKPKRAFHNVTRREDVNDA